jgi:hypothetical protein
MTEITPVLLRVVDWIRRWSFPPPRPPSVAWARTLVYHRTKVLVAGQFVVEFVQYLVRRTEVGLLPLAV